MKINRSLDTKRTIILDVVLFFVLGVIILFAGLYREQFYSHMANESKVASPHKVQEKIQANTYGDTDETQTMEIFHPLDEKSFLPGADRLNASATKMPLPKIVGIAPPLPALDIRPVAEKVNADVGRLLVTKRNSQLHIPARAFLDENGQVVQGNVDVVYREFNDFKDIFLSGIPMDLEESDQMLESAAMIEINATQDGRQLYVNPDNKITMMLASAYKDEDYNLYQYDRENKKWILKGKDEVVTQVKEGRNLLNEWYTNIDQNRDRNRDQPLQTITGANPMNFRYTPPSYSISMQCASDMRPHRTFFLGKKKDPTTLCLRFTKNKRGLPELTILRGLTWEYGGQDAMNVYRKVFRIGKNQLPMLDANYTGSVSKRGEFNTIIYTGTCAMERSGDEFTLRVVGEDSVIELPLRPVLRSNVERKSFETRWVKYVEERDRRFKADELALAKFQEDTMKYYARYGRTRSFYDDATASVETMAMRTFQVDGFGIWNCDRPIGKPSTSVFAQFVDQDGKPLELQNGYVASKKTNTVYSIWDCRKMLFDGKNENIFWAVTKDRKLAIVRPAEFVRWKEKKPQYFTFTAEVSDSLLMNESSLRSALRF